MDDRVPEIWTVPAEAYHGQALSGVLLPGQKTMVESPEREGEYRAEHAPAVNADTAKAFATLDDAPAVETLFGRRPSGEIVRIGGRSGDRGYYLVDGRVYRFRTKSTGAVNSDDLGDSPTVLTNFRIVQHKSAVRDALASGALSPEQAESLGHFRAYPDLAAKHSKGRES